MAEDNTTTDKDKDTTSDKTTTDDKDHTGKDTGKTTTTDEDEDKHQSTSDQSDYNDVLEIGKDDDKIVANLYNQIEGLVGNAAKESQLGSSTWSGLLIGEYTRATDLGGRKLQDMHNWYVTNPVANANSESTREHYFHLTYQGFNEETNGPQPKLNYQSFVGRDGGVFNSIDFQPRKINENFLLEFTDYESLQNAKTAIFSAFYGSETSFRQQNLFVHFRLGVSSDISDNSRAFSGAVEPFSINPPSGQHWCNFTITLDMLNGYYQGYRPKTTGSIKLTTADTPIDIDSQIAIDPYYQGHYMVMAITPEQSGPLEIDEEVEDGYNPWSITYDNAQGGSTVYYDGVNTYDDPNPNNSKRNNLNGILGSHYQRFYLNTGTSNWKASAPCVIKLIYYPLYWY